MDDLSLVRKADAQKIVVISMITLDGVMQAPGGPEEGTSSGFKYGGWVAPYLDEVYDKVLEKQLKPADYLLGRKTFEIFASYWPALCLLDTPGIPGDSRGFCIFRTRLCTQES